MALQLINVNHFAEFAERLAFLGGADVGGIELRAGELGADGGFADDRAVEQVQIQMPRQFLAHGDAAHAVAVRVELWRKDADADLPRQHCQHAAGHAAFRRNTDVIKPFARVVIHAARAHHAQHALDIFGTQRWLAGERIDAAIRERRRHDAEVAAVHGNGALLEINFRRRRRVAGKLIEITQHVADGAVAVAGLAFRLVNFFVQGQFATSIKRKGFQNPFEPRRRRFARNQSGGGNRAGVDHRIARPAGAGIEADGIERIAGRLHADAFQNRIAAVVFKGEAVNERLGNGLDGEFLPRVADLIDRAVRRDETDAEPVGIGLGEFRNVGRHRAVFFSGVFSVDVF